ncbi:MAG: PD-(D/E)XK nuclease family protein [Ilumatobacteraceae bacterium]
MASNTQDSLAALRKWRLVQDNSGPYRVYRDINNNIYHSVTHILKETSDKTGLERWEARLGPIEATQQRNIAATRGNMAHSQAEYLLKTSMQLARSTANKRNAIHWDDQGLARIPAPITQWALKRVRPNVPRVGWSASGYARGLSDWITENVTEIFASEFSIHHPAGFAGTCDALIGLKNNSLVLADWKTSVGRKTAIHDGQERLPDGHSYIDQCGAYSLGLTYLTGLKPTGAAIVLARRCGKPNIHTMSARELADAEQSFLERCHRYFENLQTAIHA